MPAHYRKQTQQRDKIECFQDLEKCISVIPSVSSIQTVSVGAIWGQKFHTTATHELIHVLEGDATIQYQGSSFKVSKGDVFVIPARTPHKDIAETQNYRVTYVFFEWPVKHEAIIKALHPSKILNLPVSFKTHLQLLMGELESEYTNQISHAHEHLGVIVLQLILSLLRYARRKEKQVKDARSIVSKKRQTSLALEVKKHLQEHYASIVTLDNLADLFKTSPFYLSRIYSNEFGVSIFEDLILIRIRSAKKLLGEKNLTIKEVAAAVGFSDSNYFAKVFRKVEGSSPTEYQLKLLS